MKFEVPVDGPELTGFTRREKEVICQLLTNYGLPVSNDTKSDHHFIRAKMIEIMKNEVVEEPEQPVVQEEPKAEVEAEETVTENGDQENSEKKVDTNVPEQAAPTVPAVKEKEDDQAGEKNVLQNLERFV